jgi:hypothetical protein
MTQSGSIGARREGLARIDPASRQETAMKALEKAREPTQLAGHLRTRPRPKPQAKGRFAAQNGLQKAFVTAPTD